MGVQDVLVCSSPDCGWGRYLPYLREALLNDCCAEFREHCIESHDLKPDDVEADVHLDLVEYTLTLLKQNVGAESGLRHPGIEVPSSERRVNAGFQRKPTNYKKS